MHVLKLPDYSSEEVLRKQLLYAIRNVGAAEYDRA